MQIIEKFEKKVLTRCERTGIVSKLSETRRSSQCRERKNFERSEKVLDKLRKLW